MIILVDFDGTVVSEAYPSVGKDIGAAPILRKLVAAGHKIILWTMREHNSKIGDVLAPALDWFERNQIPLYDVNINRSQWHWAGKSRKIFGHLIIDDHCAGIPLVHEEGVEKPYVDWKNLEVWLDQNGWFDGNNKKDVE